MKMKFLGMLSTGILMMATLSANATCLWIGHQPEVPANLKLLRKF